jgi:ABC-type antimicrobial peptide transport system permease subunit
VVGIAQDVRSTSLENQPGLDIYVPYTQMIAGTMTFVVRTVVEPMSLASAVTQEIWAEDSEQAVFSVTTMERLLDSSLWPRRVAVQLLIFFATASLVLAAIGIHGVMAYLVNQRRFEFGIRLALGATRRQVLGMVLGEATRLVIAGCSVGLVIAMVAGQLLSSVLYAVKPTDFVTFVIALVLLPAIALSTTCLSAWSATRTNPVDALRTGQ